MRLRRQSRSRGPGRPGGDAAVRIVTAVESLERRTLLNATLTGAIDPLQLAQGATSTPIDLNAHFGDPSVTGLAAVIVTSEGNIPLELFNQQEPVTVNNFVQFANTQSYDNTVIQRAVPGFLLQGGGYLSDQSHINTPGPIANEFTGISNTVGTIAAALTTDSVTHQADPNSATSDWFINDGNNSSLDAQKFTVFGKVIYNGMQVVDQIEALPKGAVAPTFEPNTIAGDPSGGVLPLRNYNPGSPIRTSNYVFTSTIATINPLTYSVTSDNSGIVSATINGTSLALTAGAGNGVAHITVTATDLGGNSVNSVFAVQVGQTQVLVGKGQSKLVRFTDPDGSAGVITLSGPGTAAVSFGGLGLSTTPGKGGVVTVGGTSQSVTVAVTGSTAATTLTITGSGGNGLIDLAGITSDGPMRAITGRNTAVTGNIVSAGAVATTTLAKVANGSVTYNSGATGAFNVGTMDTASFFTAAGVKSVTSGQWSGGGTMNATDVGKIVIKGAFSGNVNATSVKSFSAASVTSGTWNVSGNLASFTAGSVTGWNATLGTLGKMLVKGTVATSNVRSAGNISSVTAGTLSGSRVFAGIAGANLPATAGDFAAESTIKMVKVKTLDGSSVAAATLTNVNLGTAQAPATPAPFGAAAHKIVALVVIIDGKTVKLKNVTTAAQVAAALTAAGVASTEPEIRIL